MKTNSLTEKLALQIKDLRNIDETL